MRRFCFSVEDYRQHVIPDEGRVTRHANTMPPLIKRYRLTGHSVLSVGPRYGDQDLWFAMAGCKLTMVDSDEFMIGCLDIPHASHDPNDLQYIVGDALKPEQWFDGQPFDLLFFSGFSPDIFHHERVLSVMTEAGDLWPRSAEPFVPETLTLSKRVLKAEGLLIALFYSHGPAPAYSPNYVEAMRRQLKRAGLILLEIYDVETYPGIHMITAFRGSLERAQEALQSFDKGPNLTHINGRAQVPNEARRLFALDQISASAR